MTRNNDQEQFPVTPLDYQNRRERRPNPNSGRQFFAGLVIGLAVSCAFYFGFVPHAKGHWGSEVVMIGFIVIPVGKLLLGIGLARDWRYRGWGAGLLVSMPLVVLVAIGYLRGPR